MLKNFRMSFIAGAILATGFAVSGASHAAGPKMPPVQPLTGIDMMLTTIVQKSKMLPVQPLTGIDTMLTTIVQKAKISGTLEKDSNGNLVMDDKGNFKFNFDGKIYYPLTNPLNGELMGTSGPIGTVNGQVAFPPDFANLAFGVYAWHMNGADPSAMPPIPPVIRWTMNDITLVVAGTTYRPIPNNPDMAFEGRAFTGLGPVEIGQLLNGANGLSMSVRMSGCFAVMGESGPQAGKVGTYCSNSTFTFDLSGINSTEPMKSTIDGTGSSNCFAVLHKPGM